MRQLQLCLLCRRDFTRKANAKRHNKNLHSGQATIVPVRKVLYQGAPCYQQVPLFKYEKQFRSGTDTAPDVLAQMIEDIGEEFEELEHETRLLSDISKKKVLGIAIHTAVASDNPKDTMKFAIKAQRNTPTGVRGRMIDCVATYLSVSPNEAQEILRGILETKVGRKAGNRSPWL